MISIVGGEKIKTIILAGGIGARLWPLSRTEFPKQFLRLQGMERSLFQAAVDRGLLFGAPSDIFVVTGGRYAPEICRQLEEISCKIPMQNLLLEPCAKNTLPAILAGTLAIEAKGGDTVLVLPSDHLIRDASSFMLSVEKALSFVDDALVTFGIYPTAPETGYGYIQPGQLFGDGFYVKVFHEKPDQETAREYIEQGYLWNSGMFLYRSDIFISEVARCAPDVYTTFTQNSFSEAFEKTPAISIDHGLMEKASKVAAVQLESDWSDLGGFSALYEVYKQEADKKGNISGKDTVFIDSGKNLVYGGEGRIIALVGVDDLVVIDQKDALLVCKKDDAQKLKEVTSQLADREDPRLERLPLTYEVWGSQERIEESESSILLRFTVLAGETCLRREEEMMRRWIVTRGVGHLKNEGKRLELGDEISIMSGQEVTIQNVGEESLEILEIWLKKR